jgi:hypothetical protein
VEEGHKETLGAIGWKRGARREPSNGKLQSCHWAEEGHKEKAVERKAVELLSGGKRGVRREPSSQEL